MDEFTVDSIYRADILIKQPRHGYRFALDALLLAHFLKLDSHERALEVGCGSGVVLILLAALRQYEELVGVEIQPGMSELARENLLTNSIRDAKVVEGDINAVAPELPRQSFDLVFSNPPYRKQGSGRLNPLAEKAVARHELRLTLEDLFNVALLLLKSDGRLTTILPHFRERDFLDLASRHHLHLREHKYVHSFPSESPAFFLATVSAKPGARLQHAPLAIYDSPGVYSTEMLQLLSA